MKKISILIILLLLLSTMSFAVDIKEALKDKIGYDVRIFTTDQKFVSGKLNGFIDKFVVIETEGGKSFCYVNLDEITMFFISNKTQ